MNELIVGQEQMCEYSSRMFSAGGASQGNVRLESIEFAPELSDDEFAVPKDAKIRRVKNEEEARGKYGDLIVECAIQAKEIRKNSREFHAQGGFWQRAGRWLWEHAAGIVAFVGVLALVTGVAIRARQRNR